MNAECGIRNAEFRVWHGGRSQIAPTGAKKRNALKQVAEPLLPSAASGCHLPRGGRLSYFPSIRHCRSASKSCLNSVPHWNFRLLLPPLAAQPSVLSRRKRICAVTPKENPSCMLTQDGFRKGRTALRGIPKGRPLGRVSKGAAPLWPLRNAFCLRCTGGGP